MIKTRNLMFAAMSCIATMSLTSCATILSGSANKIYIDGDVDEPVTIVTEKQTYENVELPAMVKINRHGIDGQRVKIKSENYEYKGLYRYCPWMRGMATSQISCNNGIDKKASHVPL